MSKSNPADLWPDDLRVEEVVAPEEILQEQADYLTKRMGSLILGFVEKSISENRIDLKFIVKSNRFDAQYCLFTVMHRKEFDYPVAIDPPDIDLPNYLKKQYYQPSVTESVSDALKAGNQFNTLGLLLSSSGKTIENAWVAATPKEFSDKIGVILKSAEVRSVIVSLMAQAQRHGKTDDTKKAS